MSCEADDECASQCCGKMTHDGSLQCHALIEGSFCPRALAPLVDYSSFKSEDDGHRNDLLANELP